MRKAKEQVAHSRSLSREISCLSTHTMLHLPHLGHRCSSTPLPHPHYTLPGTLKWNTRYLHVQVSSLTPEKEEGILVTPKKCPRHTVQAGNRLFSSEKKLAPQAAVLHRNSENPAYM